MRIVSTPPHDFWVALDVDPYFDHEHDPERIVDTGFIRPVPVGDRDVLAVIRYNGEPEQPVFDVRFGEPLSAEEERTAERVIRHILGCDLDLRPFYEQAATDPVLAPKFEAFYGAKRVARANFFEEAINQIIQSQIAHKPTAKKMVYRVREAFGQRLDGPEGPVAAWPRPIRLVGADPVGMKRYGLSERKGEYVIGLADDILSGRLDVDELERLDPPAFLERVNRIRGIGPTTAQDLMLYRDRTDAWFPARKDKGLEIGFRKWIIRSYGADPDTTTEAEYLHLIRYWKGYEAAALELLFMDWVIGEKRRREAKRKRV